MGNSTYSYETSNCKHKFNRKIDAFVSKKNICGESVYVCAECGYYNAKILKL